MILKTDNSEVKFMCNKEQNERLELRFKSLLSFIRLVAEGSVDVTLLSEQQEAAQPNISAESAAADETC